MRFALLFGLALGLTACATPPNDARAAAEAIIAASAPVDALPAQDLAAGQCGLFVFAQAEPHAFILFEDEAGRAAKVLHDGQILEMGVTPQTDGFVVGDRFRRVYLHQPTNRVFTLTGLVGEESGSGPRLDDALLRVRELDGTEIVRPVAGVRSCRPAGSAS